MWRKLTNINRVLVPVDLTEGSIPAVEAARAIATGKKSQIYLIHVVPQGNGGGDDSRLQARYRAMEEFFLKKVRAKSKFACIVRTGDPADEIITFAREEGIDVIVLPVGAGRAGETGGRGPIARRIIGEAPVPVIVVKPDVPTGRRPAAATVNREEGLGMAHDERYLQAIRERVCRKCLDRTPTGLCVTSTFDACAINRYLPEIIDIVLTTEGDDIDAFTAKLRERVCAVCDHQSPGGRCDLRDDVECALDRYFPLVVEAVLEVKEAR